MLLAYNWSCAVCGFKGRFDNTAFGVEAAHVKWHCQDGPDQVDNGLCMCTLHHKALDRGVIGLDEDLRVLVSDHLEENAHTVPAFFAFRAKHLQGPRDGQPAVRPQYAGWHRENCFRG